ncbi:hypothetical protein AGR5A_Lc70080 [Agrobacterium genomosp. 5 str. CFBP 6626]|nr:hypothetical protein AGR5A_Lc70080 [Agrobacterium genomosp. 5 str. CFBP 6626]
MDKKDFALLRRLHTARQPVKHRKPHQPLQFRDVMAERGLCNPQLPRRRRHRAAIDNRDQISQPAQIQHARFTSQVQNAIMTSNRRPGLGQKDLCRAVRLSRHLSGRLVERRWGKTRFLW